MRPRRSGGSLNLTLQGVIVSGPLMGSGSAGVPRSRGVEDLVDGRQDQQPLRQTASDKFTSALSRFPSVVCIRGVAAPRGTKGRKTP